MGVWEEHEKESSVARCTRLVHVLVRLVQVFLRRRVGLLEERHLGRGRAALQPPGRWLGRCEILVSAGAVCAVCGGGRVAAANKRQLSLERRACHARPDACLRRPRGRIRAASSSRLLGGPFFLY